MVRATAKIYRLVAGDFVVAWAPDTGKYLLLECGYRIADMQLINPIVPPPGSQVCFRDCLIWPNGWPLTRPLERNGAALSMPAWRDRTRLSKRGFRRHSRR